jgi:TATA-binding protein-associated factor
VPVASQMFYVINPFNVIFNRAIYELVCPRWEYRHASGLILKSILKSNGFEYLDFKMFIDAQAYDQTDQFGLLLKLKLKEYAEDVHQLYGKATVILTRCLVVIAMDRFADYMNDQTHMLVRELACQISINLLAEFRFWSNYESEFMQYIDLLKRFVQVSRESQTYEVCQSALFLVKGIYQSKRIEKIPLEFSELLLSIADESIYDEILTLVCELWRLFLSSPSVPPTY